MKYMGSKNRVAKHIVPILQSIIDTHNIKVYLENFCGSCSILERIHCPTRIAADKDINIITLMQSVASGWIPPECLTKEEWQTLKQQQEPSPLKSFAAYCCSYSGKYFTAYAQDKTNQNYAKQGSSALQKTAKRISDVIFINCDYSSIYTSNSLIYLDPPYRNHNEYKVSINFDYEAFYDWARELSKTNIVIISEYEMPPDFRCILEIPRKSIMGGNHKPKQVIDKLFTLNNI